MYSTLKNTQEHSSIAGNEEWELLLPAEGVVEELTRIDIDGAAYDDYELSEEEKSIHHLWTLENLPVLKNNCFCIVALGNEFAR